MSMLIGMVQGLNLARDTDLFLLLVLGVLGQSEPSHSRVPRVAWNIRKIEISNYLTIKLTSKASTIP